MRILKLFFLAFLLFWALNNSALSSNKLPSLFLYLGHDSANSCEKKLYPYVSGVQIIYSWDQLEPKKGMYDFSKIKEDLKFLNKHGKKLFIQLQDRSFEPDVFHVPDYIREEKEYHGGVAMQYDFPGEGKPITTGWVARVWDPAVRERFQRLIQKLGEEFDEKIYGINLPETAVDFDNNNPPEGFTYDKYFESELENLAALRKAFHKSIVIQYVNFFPGEWNNDHGYMSRLFSFAIQHQIGLGGPDVVPYRPAQMKNSYPFFHKLNDKLFVGMAIQPPDYSYKNPETGLPYTFDEFYFFTKNYLGADILFWNLEEPFFSNQLAPNINKNFFNYT